MPLRFRRLSRDDFPLLSQWLAAPHVEAWWRDDPSLDAIEKEYGNSVDGSDPTECFIVERDGAPVGFIQRYLIGDDAGWQRTMSVVPEAAGACGIDYLIGDPGLIGQGLGGEIIERFVGDIWRRYPDLPAIAVAVQQDNRRSWRVLEKAGFRRAWAGILDSDHPSDSGPSFVYLRTRPESATGRQGVPR